MGFLWGLSVPVGLGRQLALSNTRGGSVLCRRHLTRSQASNHHPQRSGSPSSAYVHLPFCRRRCYYCDFPVTVVGDKGASRSAAVYDGMATYVDRLCGEIRAQQVVAGATTDENDGSQESMRPLRTVYFGGGTPSLLPPALLERILVALDDKFGLDIGNSSGGATEITLECDPGTFDRERLLEYVGLGVNRLSVGVQTFDAALLNSIGRAHTLGDVHQALDDIHAVVTGGKPSGGNERRAVGIRSFSIDLMSGLPGQTMATWEHSVASAIKFGAPHVSMYDLVVEPRTSFGRWAAAGTIALPPDDVAAEMYRVGSSMLRAEGYTHYEISNYAQPGHACAHNEMYWTRLPYYAFGVGAASYLRGRRVERPRTLTAYYSWLDTHLNFVHPPGRSDDVGGGIEKSCAEDTEGEDALLEALMLSLRTSGGVYFSDLQTEFGSEAASAVRRSLSKFSPQWVTLDANRASLTDPEGMLFSNDVISSAIADCCMK